MATALAPAANSNLRIRIRPVSLVLKEYDFAIRFAAGLEPDAQLRHYGVADEPIMHIHLNPRLELHRRRGTRQSLEYSVGITIVEKDSTFSGMFESLNRLIVSFA